MNNLYLKTGFRFGIIASILTTLIGLALLFTGMADYSGSSSGWTSTLILALGVYLAAEGFKKENQGFMSHKDLIKVSLWMGLFAGIFSAVFGFIHAKMDPTLFDLQKNRMEVELENKRLDDAQIEQSMKMVNVMLEPVPMAIMIIITIFISMVVIGAIMGFFLKKEKDVFDSLDNQ